MKRRNKQSIPRYLRLQVFERDGYTCRYCGKTVARPHCDHVYPESRGGATELGNLVTSCAKCNHDKHVHLGTWPMPVDFQQQIGQLSGRVLELEDQTNQLETQHQQVKQNVMKIDIGIPLLSTLAFAVLAFGMLLFGLESGNGGWTIAGLLVLPIAAIVAVVLYLINANLERRHRKALGGHVRAAHREQGKTSDASAA